jgi:hypothetical protein
MNTNFPLAFLTVSLQKINVYFIVIKQKPNSEKSTMAAAGGRRLCEGMHALGDDLTL